MLYDEMLQAGKVVEFYTYDETTITSQRISAWQCSATVEFFDRYLKTN